MCIDLVKYFIRDFKAQVARNSIEPAQPHFSRPPDRLTASRLGSSRRLQGLQGLHRSYVFSGEIKWDVQGAVSSFPFELILQVVWHVMLFPCSSLTISSGAAGYANWVHGWSRIKKECTRWWNWIRIRYSKQRKQLHPFIIFHPSLCAISQRFTMQEWCCAHETMGCQVTTLMPYEPRQQTACPFPDIATKPFVHCGKPRQNTMIYFLFIYIYILIYETSVKNNNVFVNLNNWLIMILTR